MFEYIKGTLVEITPHQAIVDVKGMGYALHIPANTQAHMPPIGHEVHFYTSTLIREDRWQHFAFLTREERDLFTHLTTISGIGPKIALAFLGHMKNSDLQIAIATGNISLLTTIPGIGKKTAERICIELRDTIRREWEKSRLTPSPLQNQKIRDAVSALTHLGYNAFKAQQAVATAMSQFEGEPSLDDLIKRSMNLSADSFIHP